MVLACEDAREGMTLVLEAEAAMDAGGRLAVLK
jgi:hypothetical protein